MNSFAWFALAAAIVILSVVVGCLVAVVGLMRDDWTPDTDGFSDEEE